jgi:hypothetical protein
MMRAYDEGGYDEERMMRAYDVHEEYDEGV